MKITRLHRYSWFSNLAYVKWDRQKSESTDARISAANNELRIPGRVDGIDDSSSNTRGEKIFNPSAKGGLDWNIVNYHPNDPDSGFAASLYSDGSEKVLAIRGTEPKLGPIIIDDLINADLREIVRLGVAVEQTISLVNWIRRLEAPAGANVEQLTLPSDVALFALAALPKSMVSGFAFDRLLDLLDRENLAGGGLGQLSASDAVTVTGHSLGGHLSLLAARLFPHLFDHAVTFNAPGFDTPTSHGLTDRLVAWLRESGFAPNATNFASLSTTNLQAESSGPGFLVDDLDPIADLGTMPNGKQQVLIEVSTHSQDQFMHDLGVHALLERMLSGNGGAITFDDTNALFAAASSIQANTSETIVDDIFQILSPSEFDAHGPLQIGAGGAFIMSPSFESRTAFSERLLALETALDNNRGIKIASLLASSASLIATIAEENTDLGLAYRYALHALNPFVLTDDSAQATDAIYRAPALGVDLDLFDPETGERNITTQYLNDRAVFLTQKITAAIDDSDNIASLDVFEDRETGLVLTHPDATTASMRHNRNYIFGSRNHDSIIGASGADHLYGGEGSDDLFGGGGADYIEGNAGNDRLEGGQGADTLRGGAGTDRYYVGDGDVVIDDATGAGRIYFRENLADGSSNDILLTHGYQNAGDAPGTFNSSDEKFVTNCAASDLPQSSTTAVVRTTQSRLITICQVIWVLIYMRSTSMRIGYLRAPAPAK